MKIDVITLFPDMFAGPFGESMVSRAVDEGLADITIHNLRDWTEDRHKTVDDRPYGGGPGMVMRVDVIDRAVSELKNEHLNSQVVLLSAKGERYTQQRAQRLAKLDHLVLICGHYEGVDHRVHEHIADTVISIGEYVLTGGEIPAMVVVDSVVRLIPGVVGAPASIEDESHKKPGYIEYPQYSRPDEYKGWTVPDVLLSGDHAAIDQWRIEHSQKDDSP